jgi:hypothetical protein
MSNCQYATQALIWEQRGAEWGIWEFKRWLCPCPRSSSNPRQMVAECGVITSTAVYCFHTPKMGGSAPSLPIRVPQQANEYDLCTFYYALWDFIVVLTPMSPARISGPKLQCPVRSP